MVEDVSGNFFFDFDNGAYCTPVSPARDVVLSVDAHAALSLVVALSGLASFALFGGGLF